MKKLNGVKFFQQDLDFLYLHCHEYSGNERLTAASISAFILMHFHCDEFGRIREDEFVLKQMTAKYKLPYSSIHKGFHLLFSLGLLEYVTHNGKHYIVIKQYEQNNTPDIDGKMNYFTIPHHLLSSGILNDFIKARDVSGIIGLLDMLNGLARDHSRRKKNSRVLKVSTLLRKMKKTTRNLTDWLNRLVLLVNHKVEADTEKNALKSKKFAFTFVLDCFNENEYDQEKANIRAALRKELQGMLSSLKVPYSGRDSRDAFFALQQDCLNIFYPITNLPNGLRELRLIMQDTVQKAQLILDQRIGDKINNFGGFFRTLIRPLLKTQYEELPTAFKVEVKKPFNKLKQPLPSFLNAYETFA